MIPKIINYCWFGGAEKSVHTKKCIESWRKYCPDYKIIEWNERNFDIMSHPYLKWCYTNQKWAFLSDFARLLIVYQHGGLYFDVDVELLRSPDELLPYKAFFGFESEQCINTGEGFGAIAGHDMIQSMIRVYEELQPTEDGSYPLTACPELNTIALLPYGLKQNGTRQNIMGAEILPIEYLNPLDDPTGRINKTPNTIAIHWYSKSWLDKKVVFRSKITRLFHRYFGKDCFDFIKKLRGKSQ